MNELQHRVMPGFVESPIFGARPLRKVLTNLCITLTIGFIAMTTFEGPFRYYAARAHVAWLPYLKDVLLIAALIFGMAKATIIDLRNLAFFVALAFIAVGTIYGGLNLRDFRQPLFAARTWLPLLCGTVVASSVDTQSKAFHWSCAVLWFITVCGVFLTWKWHAPWVGFDYEVGGVEVDSSREWSMGGVDRLAGLSRSSYDAALECLFLAIMAAICSRYYLVSLPIWTISAAAIYLTTSRSAAAALAVAMGAHVLVAFNRTSQWLAKIGVVAVAIMLVALPFGAARYYKNKATDTASASIASTSSFADRATQTWPQAFELQKRGGSRVLGRGLGGIGVAQKFFEPANYNPGDNFFVYLWVAFGMFGIVFLGFILFQVLRAYVPMDKNRKAGVLVVGSFLAAGLTLNGIESPIASLFLGMGLAWLSQSPS
jgi:hypothetical protein